MIEDLRYAARQFRKSPGFAAAAVVTLALGIAAAAAMFGLIQGVLLSPPPYADPHRLVLVSPARLDGQPFTQGPTMSQWIEWRTSSRTLDATALYRWTFNFLVLPEGSESLSGMAVTQDFFRVLGLKPIVGREFLPHEASRPKVPASAIMLGYELWQRRFNGDPSIVGKPVTLSRFPAPLPVVGIMPAGVRFLPDPATASEPNYDVNGFVDFWLLTAPDETQVRARAGHAVSRLRDGATLEQAQVELAAMAATQAKTDTRLESLTVSARLVVEELNRDARALLVPLFGFVALLFFVACVNVAGLFVARGLQRHREYAMRSALGASRLRLFRQVITESAAIAMLGAVAGAGLAVAIVALFKAVGGDAIPRADMVTVGWPVFVFGVAAALVAAFVSGLLPALRASSSGRVHALEGTRTSAGRVERRLLEAIATVQIVFTVALLAGAALLIRTTSKLANIRPGYDIENILAVTVTSVAPGTPSSFREFHTQVLDRVAALPGVSRAAFVWGLPLTGNKWPGSMELIGRPDAGTPAGEHSFPFRAVTPDYFAVMGIELMAGRLFTAFDNNDAPRVIIINQTLATRYYPGQNPIGQQMRPPGNQKVTFEIVGVVADTRTEALSRQADPEIYFSFWQNGAFSKHLVLRAAADPSALTSLVRREVHAVEPTAAVEHATTMVEIRRESLAPRTFAMRLLFGFSVLATGLALVGIYGVLSLSVGSRIKEIAVRKAIGAQQQDILRSILGEGGRLIVIGVTLGAAVSVLLGRALEGLLYDVQSADPISLAAAALIFATVALGACLFPAVRAARTDLLAALHHE